MNLVKEIWTKDNINQFESYLTSLGKGKEKADWEKRIVNTQLPCLAVPSTEVKKIIKEIYKGNYLSFLDLWIWNFWTETSIIGGLICKIKEFEIFERYLNKYADFCDNWATSDCLKFEIRENTKQKYFDLTKKFIKSNKLFKRRIGMTILFKFVDDDKFINKIFDILNSFINEKEYYVNMVNAWLVAECFTKQRDKTIEFLKTNKLNKFTINKAISKCRDSFRISKEDKEMLLNFKVK